MAIATALIVDDSKLARITLKKKLESMGLQVGMVESAEQAFKYLAEQQPDIVFMDHLMPDIDGFEATQRIRQQLQLKQLPIVMCTGKDHDGYLEEALAIGANYILSKPPVDEALIAILQADHSGPMDEEGDIPVVGVDIPTLQAEDIVPVLTIPMVHTGLSHDEIQLLCEEMLLANKAEFIKEVLASVPVQAPIEVNVDAIVASVKQQVMADVLASLPKPEALVQDNDSLLDMDSLLSTVNASVNHQFAVNADSMKAAVIEQVQSQLSTMITDRVTKIVEHDIQGLLDLRLSVTLAEKTATTQKQLDELKAKLEEMGSAMADSDSATPSISAATNAKPAGNKDHLYEKAFQSQVQMQHDMQKIQKMGMAAIGVAGLAVLLALIAMFV